MTFESRTVVVTGAAGGIGSTRGCERIVRQLA